MERRPNTLKGNFGFLALLLLLAVACSIRFALTDQIRMDLYPIPLMIVVYLGYKLGRKAGAIAGCICSWFWTIIFILSDNDFTGSQILLNGVSIEKDGVSLIGHSLQHGILIAMLGWVSAYLCDRLDTALKKTGSSIAEIFPARGSRRSFAIGAFQFPERKGTTQAPADKPQPSKSDLKKRILQKTAVIPFTAVLVLLNHHLTFFLPPLEFSVPPMHVVTLAVLIWAFHKGSAFGVRLAVLVWVISLIVGIYFQFILTEITRAIRISFSIRTPAQAVGLAVLAWWAGQIGLVYKDKQRLKKISQLWAPLRRHQPLSVDPGYGVLFVAFLFFIQLHIAIKAAGSGHAAVSFSFNALVLVIALVSIWSLRHNGQAISNRILPLMLLYATFHYQYVIGGIRLASSYIDLLDIMSLCLIPIITSYLEIKERVHWRILIFGTLIALILPDIYVRGGYVPFFAILELSFVKTNLVLLTWALALAGFELVTRICTLAAFTGDDQPEP